MQRVIVNVASALVILLITSPLLAQESRSIDGSGNNLEYPTWGAIGAEMPRGNTIKYSDGFSEIADEGLPNPRDISNKIFSQEFKINDQDNHSDFVWAFGQFLDHDISLVHNNNDEALFIDIPFDDQFMVPGGAILMSRSKVMDGTGTGPGNPRQYQNDVTSYLDGSMVYGSTIERAQWLRTNDGTGKLRVTKDNLLPWNTISGERNDEIDPSAPEMADDTHQLDYLFVAGDVRANENPLLISLHTLFVREHNRLCEFYAEQNPNWTGEQLYEKSRKMIGAYLQAITYEEWLPSIDVFIPNYTGYREDVNATINNVFSAAAFRMGHTLLNSEVIRMNNEGSIIPLGNISLKESFFQPRQIFFAGGIEPYIKGMATQVQQEMDAKVIDDVRNFLFGSGPFGGLDLAAININRGRDRGLADYNTIRDDLGLNKLNSFSNLTTTQEEAQSLEELYGDINNLDAWVGMLAEKHITGSMFGELVNTIIERQFQDLRDGDRFYYENDPSLTPSEKEAIKDTRLHDIIMRNCSIELMQYDVFNAMPHGDIPTGPELVQSHLEAALYPNPVGTQAQLKVLSQKNEEVTVTIFDMHGRSVYSIDGVLINGENFLSIDFDSNTWHRGLYTLVIRTENDFNTLKLIVE